MATQFKDAVASSFGTPNPFTGYPSNGPYFAYQISGIGGIFTNAMTFSTGDFSSFALSVNSASVTFAYLVSSMSLGPSSADTQISLQNLANALQGAYTVQTSALNNGLTYDCNVFDAKGICLSTGGRYTTTNGNNFNTTSGLVLGGYKINDHYRAGAWIDQNLSASSTTGVNLGNSTPMFGVYGVWNENKSGIGTEVRASAGYGGRSATLTRSVVGTSEAGSGSTNLNTSGVSLVASYNIQAAPNWVASPYVGIRYTNSVMNGYTEGTSTAVTAPLTYNNLAQESTSLLAGVKLAGKVDDKIGVYGSAGLEQDIKKNGGDMNATGVTGLTTVSLIANPQNTRPVANIGAYYEIDKSQRVGINAIYRMEAYQSSNTLTGMATYTVGF